MDQAEKQHHTDGGGGPPRWPTQQLASPEEQRRQMLNINESVVCDSTYDQERGSSEMLDRQRYDNRSTVHQDARIKDNDIVIEESNEEKSSASRKDNSFLSHHRIMNSRNQSQNKKYSQYRLSQQDNLGGPSEVSISESELKMSLHTNLFQQLQIPSTIDAAQDTVLQQRMEMMPKKHRNMLLKQSIQQQKASAAMDSSISVQRLDMFFAEQAHLQNQVPRQSFESVAFGMNRKSVFLAQSRKNSNNPKEFAYLNDLTIFQKMQIVFYNCFETLLVFALLVNSLLHFDLSVLVQFLMALLLVHQLTSQTNNTRYKQTLVWVIFTFSLISIFTKAALVAAGIASSSKGKNDEWISFYQSIGCKFSQDEKGTSNLILMLVSDIVFISVCFPYFFLLRTLAKANRGKLRIQRVRTRVLAAPRSRAVPQIDQGKDQGAADGKFDASVNLGTAANLKDIGGQKVSPMLELLLPNSKKVEDEVKQCILFHNYFGEIQQHIYCVLSILLIVNVAMLQAVPQFLIYTFIIFQMYRWLHDTNGSGQNQTQRHNTLYQAQNQQQQQSIQFNELFARKAPDLKEISKRRSMVNCIQIVIFLQAVSTFVFNIDIVKQQFKVDATSSKDQGQFETWLRLFGISFVSINAEFYRTGHLITISAILCLSSTFKSSVQCLLQPYSQQGDSDQHMRSHTNYSSHARQGAGKDQPSYDDTDNNFFDGAEFNSDIDKYKRNGKTITKQQVFSTFQQPLLAKKGPTPQKRHTISSEDSKSNKLLIGFGPQKGQQLNAEEAQPQQQQQQNNANALTPSSQRKGLLRRYFPQVLIWLCRIMALLFTYAYRNWQSFVTLVWVCHSALIQHPKSFSVTTRKYYLPLFILIVLAYYVINIDGVVDEHLFEVERIQIYGIIRFTYPAAEVLLMYAMLASYFVWIKISEEIQPEDEDYRVLGLRFAIYMSSKDQYTLFHLILLAYPLIEVALLIMILLSGLVKTNLYHITVLFLFIGFLGLPGRKMILTRFLLYFSVFFLIAKYIFSLVEGELERKPKDEYEDMRRILDALGISTYCENSQNWSFFEYGFIWQQSSVLFFGYFYYIIQRFFGDPDIPRCFQQARQNLRYRYPKTHKFLQFIYNLKKSIIIFMVFSLFYALITVGSRSFINWGFLIIWSILFFVELSFSFNSAQSITLKKNAWSLMIFYSALVILIQFVYIFSRTPIVQNSEFVRNFVESLPEWVKENPDIIGFEQNGEEGPATTTSSVQHSFMVRYLIFFLFSVYIKSEIIKWHKDEEEFQKQLLNTFEHLNQSNEQQRIQKKIGKDMISTSRGSFLSQGTLFLSMVKLQKQDIDKMTIKQQLETTMLKKTEISLQYNRIRFTPEYLAYSLRSFWSVLDLFAQFNHMILQFIILWLTLFWWLNLVNCLQLLAFVLFNIRVGKKVGDIMDAHYREFAPPQADEGKGKKRRRQKSAQVKDVDLVAIKARFDQDVGAAILKERHNAWNYHYLLVLLTLVIIFPTEILGRFEKMAAEDLELRRQMLTVIYYMFLGGLYHERYDENSGQGRWSFYTHYIYGYLIILAMCIVERVCILWLRGRFGCDEHAYSIIDQFQKKIIEIDSQISKLEQRLQDAELIQRRQNMKRLRTCKDRVEEEPEKPKVLITEDMDKIEEQDEDLSFEFSAKASKQGLPVVAASSAEEVENDEEEKEQQSSRSKYPAINVSPDSPLYVKKLKEELGLRLLVDSKMNNMRGIKVVLQTTIVLLLLISAILKMNISSIIYFVLVVIFMRFKTYGAMRLVMDTTSMILFLRLILILSNYQKEFSPKGFPKELDGISKDLDMNFTIPWINHMQGFKNHDPQIADYSYFFMWTMVPQKINSLLLDFVILCLIFIFYQNCQFWCVNKNYEVFISSDTQQMLNEYMKLIDFDPEQTHNLTFLNPKQREHSLAQAKSERSDEERSNDGLSAMENDQRIDVTPRSNNDTKKSASHRERSKMSKLIKNLQGSNFWYRLYKHLQRSAIIHNPKFFIAAVLTLAIASNTIFSLAFITFLSYAMLRYQLFLEVNLARFVLRPIIQNIMMPLVLLEILLHILYQMPIEELKRGSMSTAMRHVITLFGLEKGWVVYVDTQENTIKFNENGYNVNEMMRLCCKALIFFFLSIQAQIFRSKSFERINDIKRVGRMKGEAMTFRFNNKKIKQYLKYQSINLKKEQMMIKVKAKFDRWRALFEKQAEQQYMKETLVNQGALSARGQAAAATAVNDPQDQIPSRNNSVMFHDLQMDRDKFIGMQEAEGAPNDRSSLAAGETVRAGSYTGSQGAFKFDQTHKSPYRTSEVGELYKSGSEQQEVIRSVNSDFLAIRRLSIKQEMQRKFRQKLLMNENGKNDQAAHTLTQDKQIEQLSELQEYRKAKLKEKKQQLPLLVFIYIRLRKKCVNPILFANDVSRMEAIRKDMKEGSTQVRSSIEYAMLNDIKSEEQTGVPTTKHLDVQIRFSRMLMRYAKLIQQIGQSNVDILAYIFMLTETILNPGILTLVYPLSVFGYALMEETRPRRYFWYLIMLYTQLLLIFQFVLSLRFWEDLFKKPDGSKAYDYPLALQAEFNKIFLGMMVLDGDQIGRLLLAFLPKILILWASVSFVHNEVILRLHEKKEQDIEAISQAYKRFVLGQYGVKIDKVAKEAEREDGDADGDGPPPYTSISDDLNRIVYNSNLGRSIDDFYITYSPPASDSSPHLQLDREEIAEYLEDYRPFKSQQDIYDDTGAQFDDLALADRVLLGRRRWRFMKVIQKQLSDVFVRNYYMQKLYPSLKIQKPGIDYYQQMVFFQVLIGLYILIWYPDMTAEEDTIIKQINKSQFSGNMVAFLTLIIIIIIIDRYIYKSRTFRQHDASEFKKAKKKMITEAVPAEGNQRNQAEQPSLRKVQSLLTTPGKPQDFNDFVPIAQSQPSIVDKQPALRPVASQKRSKLRRLTDDSLKQQLSKSGHAVDVDQLSASDQNSTGKGKKDHGADDDSAQQFYNMDELLARSKISFKTVQKYYFQWVLLFLGHGVLVFYLPYAGNIKLNNEYYCDPSRKQNKDPAFENYKCNDLNENKYITIFYILVCFYFYVSAIQIKYGLPEVMTSYFMLNRYHWLNKYIFLGFYNIPFIFELRTIIDWTYAKSSLDVYQWIKLAQIQTDLYKAKCNNLFYMSKKVGEPLPSWYRYLVGLGLIFLILALSLGPMFVFSSFDVFGDINPVNTVQVQLSLVVTANGRTQQQKLFDTSSILEKEELTEQQYAEIMQFGVQYQTRSYERKQVQYIIMNNYSQEKLSISNKLKENFRSALNESRSYAPDDFKKNVFIEVRYAFSRQAPRSALNPIGNQTVPFSGDEQARNKTIDQFINAFTRNLYNKSEEQTYNITIPGFKPLIALGQTLNVESIIIPTSKDYESDLTLSQDADEQWTVQSEPYDRERELRENIQKNSKKEAHAYGQNGLSFFVFSRKTLPSIINFPLITFYISIVYVIAKLFRTGLVPITAAILINDSPFPEDILMLCETIKLYRLKGRLDDEEELFFLLIDIMRSPQVLKAICGDSTKILEKQLVAERKAKVEQEAKEARWRELVNQQHPPDLSKQRPTTPFGTPQRPGSPGSKRRESERQRSIRAQFVRKMSSQREKEKKD